MSDRAEEDAASGAGAHELYESDSRVVVHTKATGLLARFAHDLEIAAPRIEADVEVDGERWTATLRFSVPALQVVGVLKKGAVDKTVLSPGDRDEIRQRMDEQVFPRTPFVVVRASGERPSGGTATVELHTGRQTVSLQQRVERRGEGEAMVEGRVALSLRALGVKEIKGPLGAFKVHDDVEVHYALCVRPRSAES